MSRRAHPCGTATRVCVEGHDDTARGSPNGHRVAGRRPVSGSGTEAREAATERAVLRMVALAAQAARFRYADGWLRRLLSAFAELARRRL